MVWPNVLQRHFICGISLMVGPKKQKCYSKNQDKIFFQNDSLPKILLILPLLKNVLLNYNSIMSRAVDRSTIQF